MARTVSDHCWLCCFLILWFRVGKPQVAQRLHATATAQGAYVHLLLLPSLLLLAGGSCAVMCCTTPTPHLQQLPRICMALTFTLLLLLLPLLLPLPLSLSLPLPLLLLLLLVAGGSRAVMCCTTPTQLAA
jgi:hypothetical protein